MGVVAASVEQRVLLEYGRRANSKCGSMDYVYESIG